MAIAYDQPSLYPILTELDFTTVGLTTGVLLNPNPLPNTCRIFIARIIIQTPFNASFNSYLRSGWSAGGGEICINISIAGAANTLIELPQARSVNPLTSDRFVYARGDFTGTAPTQGKLHFEIVAAIS